MAIIAVIAAAQRETRKHDERRREALQQVRFLSLDGHLEILGATGAERTEGAMLGR
jgi:hypothetical protein